MYHIPFLVSIRFVDIPFTDNFKISIKMSIGFSLSKTKMISFVNDKAPFEKVILNLFELCAKKLYFLGSLI